MKFAVQFLSVLAAAGLLGAVATTPAAASKKAKKDPNLFELIEADLKAIDKALFGPFTKTKK